MNAKNIINEFTECEGFEMRIRNNQLVVYYYDKVKHFSNNKIIILKDDIKYIITGKEMVIETMFKEKVIIKGKISNISFGE